MILKINQKPIKVTEDTEEEKDFSVGYFAISCVGYGLILGLLDYTCSIFFFIHPFPLFTWIGGLLSWIL